MSHKGIKIHSTAQNNRKSAFNVGFREVRQRVEKGSKYTKSCFNCDYYYQAVGDRTEVCQNPNVIKYDMVITENNIYCTQWILTHREEKNPVNSVKGLFKKRG